MKKPGAMARLSLKKSEWSGLHFPICLGAGKKVPAGQCISCKACTEGQFLLLREYSPPGSHTVGSCGRAAPQQGEGQRGGRGGGTLPHTVKCFRVCKTSTSGESREHLGRPQHHFPWPEGCFSNLLSQTLDFHVLDLFRILQKPSEISITLTTSLEVEAQENDVPSLPLHTSDGDLTGENQFKYLWPHKINTK